MKTRSQTIQKIKSSNTQHRNTGFAQQTHQVAKLPDELVIDKLRFSDQNGMKIDEEVDDFLTDSGEHSSKLSENYCDKLRNHKKIYDINDVVLRNTSFIRKTPSPTPLFIPNIDFDEASRAWLQNKKKVGNGCYMYIKIGQMDT